MEEINIKVIEIAQKPQQPQGNDFIRLIVEIGYRKTEVWTHQNNIDTLQFDNSVDRLCKLMSEYITSQRQTQLPAPEIIAKAAEEKAQAEFKVQEQAKELERLQEENKALQERIDKARKELIRVQTEQKTFGKIKVNTTL